MFVAMKQSVVRTLYYVFIILSFVMTPWLIFFYNLMAGRQFLLSFAALLLVLITGIHLCEELRLEKRNVLLFPLGAIVMSVVMLNSMLQILLKGRAEWRGRHYPLPPG